ncbi:elongation factor 1-gamma [Schizopora paradoxa]|uniref:Elongation factor 1-gamma n=1 Tax=Schizopora paradoxa TaxID=27342 RepID=A0A0H2S195_9AGAM|nr:elongation factor 1-gamma [Schizopora paradoxa]
MSAGTLWTTPTSGEGKAFRAVAAYGGVKIDIPTDYKHYEDNKKPEFLTQFPLGKIPAFKGTDGFVLTETFAISRYIASLAPNSTLLGSSPKEAALIDQWLSFSITEIRTSLRTIYALIKGVYPYNKNIHTAMVDSQIRAFKVLSEHLQTQTFLVGERPSLADFMLAGVLSSTFAMTFDAALRQQFPNIVRYYETVTGHPSVKDIFGATEYIEKAVQFVPPKKEEKPKQEKPKKEEKKPAPKKKEEDEEEEEESYEEPKAKNPLDLLPKSTFNLEDWKRFYSNNEVRGPGGSLEWFYNNFDKEGFSIWRVDYKYGKELTETFMSSNLIRGFFTRLEGSRKYLFGYLCVLGVKNDSLISGVFICRGKDIMPVVEVAPDWESYDFKPIDLESALDKTFFEQAMAEELELEGKKWADGKSFK